MESHYSQWMIFPQKLLLSEHAHDRPIHPWRTVIPMWLCCTFFQTTQIEWRLINVCLSPFRFFDLPRALIVRVLLPPKDCSSALTKGSWDTKDYFFVCFLFGSFGKMCNRATLECRCTMGEYVCHEHAQRATVFVGKSSIGNSAVPHPPRGQKNFEL